MTEKEAQSIIDRCWNDNDCDTCPYCQKNSCIFMFNNVPPSQLNSAWLLDSIEENGFNKELYRKAKILIKLERI